MSELKWLIWHITNKCNFNCAFCYTRSNPTADKGLETKELIGISREINESNVDVINLIGGEPFVRKDFYQIIDSLNPQVKINLDTNGSLIKSNWKSSYNNRFHKINIGLDGEPRDNEVERKFTKKVIQNILFLQDQEMKITITSVITKKNFKNIERNVNFLLALFPNYIQLNIYGEVLGENTKDLKLDINELNYVYLKIKPYLKTYNNIGISGMKTSLFFDEFESTETTRACGCAYYRGSISVKGYLFPCPVLANYEDFISEDLKHDLQLNKNSIDKIYNSDLFEIWRNAKKYNPIKCSNCEYINKCNTGCRAFNFLLERKLPGNLVFGCEV